MLYCYTYLILDIIFYLVREFYIQTILRMTIFRLSFDRTWPEIKLSESIVYNNNKI